MKAISIRGREREAMPAESIATKTCRMAAGGVLFLSILAAAPAEAQSIRDKTAPDQDPRRSQAGAKITSEANPTQENKVKDDSERLHDSYQPKGIDLGSFLLLPKVELNESYNTNLFAEESNPKAGFVTAVRPEFKLRSRFSEHALDLSFLAEQFLNHSYGRDNRLDLQMQANGRYDAAAGTEITSTFQAYSQHEERGSPDDARGLEPTPTRGIVTRLGGKHEMGHFTAFGEVGADRRTFGNVETALGTTVPNEDRDRWEVMAKARGSYELFPGYAAVTEVSANTRRYDLAHDRNGYERDSTGYRVETGIGLDISQLLRGDFLVGYFAQNYRDARLSDPRGLSVRASFNWTPDKLTVIVPSLERSVAETTTTGASALVRTSASMMVRHELQRNILLTGSANVSYDELKGLDQVSWTYEGRGRVTYALTPQAFFGGEVARKTKDTDIPGSSFRQSIFMLLLGLQM